MIISTQNRATKGKLLALVVLLAAIASLILVAGPSYASTTFTVNSTEDHADAINFNIPGTGVKTIAPGSALPTITEAVTIDGYTQAGASANTKAVGNDAVLRIKLSGASAAGADGLVIGAA